MTAPLEVHTIAVGPLQANCHIVANRETGEAVVVDPGDEAETILDFAKAEKLRVVAIWNTHAHIDHINGNAGVQAATGAPISIHRIEADWLASPVLTLAVWAGVVFHPSRADVLWSGGETIHLLGREWRVHHAPGHSPGGCVVASAGEGFLLGGDLLFQGSIGRVDLPGGDPVAMMRSLRSMFTDWATDDNQIVHGGHGPACRIGQERRRNPYVLEALAS